MGHRRGVAGADRCVGTGWHSGHLPGAGRRRRPVRAGPPALGLGPGDTFATLLPNSSTALAMYFAAIETGLYVVPVNWHQVGAEIGYILSDSDARVLVADDRFAAAATEAAGLAGVKHRFAVGTVPGFEPLA